jgi:integrase
VVRRSFACGSAAEPIGSGIVAPGEIQQFAPRLALALLLYTAQRRSDVVVMGRQHVRDGVLIVRQGKTGRLVEIPIHSTLAEILAGTPSEHLTFLTTGAGKPFSAAGFGNLFREWCDEAALPQHCSAHGLRKAACRRLAEAGCTEHQIAAISGHLSLSEIQRYTRAASRAKMARAAIAIVTRAFSEVEE